MPNLYCVLKFLPLLLYLFLSLLDPSLTPLLTLSFDETLCLLQLLSSLALLIEVNLIEYNQCLEILLSLI